jgi:hypothetical protein
MNIKGINKAKILAALFNHSRPQGMGLFSSLARGSHDMSEEEAQGFLDAGQTYFDYVHGRILKIDLEGDELSTRLYNRDLGEGAAEYALRDIVK